MNNTKYALNTAIKTLEYYEKFFEIDYQLEKLGILINLPFNESLSIKTLMKFEFSDLVALPVFVSGAMENWGIITFRETNLLYSEQGSSTNEKKRVAAVIAHELAHMVCNHLCNCLSNFNYFLFSGSEIW